ncbi:MAG: spore coat protein [Eubacteriales bacterium]|nr:spore coat protein [Eubacteriales bacterium]
MDEKTMVSDTLASINSDLVRMGEMISQTENPQLKNTLKQMRNQCEASQEEIYQIARSKQYYVPAAKATAEEIQHVRQILSQG